MVLALAATAVATLIAPYAVHSYVMPPDVRTAAGERPTQKEVDDLAARVEKNPNDIDAHCALASCYERLGLPELASEQYAIAVKLAPNNPQMWLVRAKQELKSGQTKQAIKLIQAAHDRFGDDPEVLFWFGNMLAAQAQNDNAEFTYKLALEKNPNIEGLRSALGQLCLEQARYGDALVLANQELRLYPTFPLAFKVKGIALMGLSKPDQAIGPLRIAYQAYHQPTLARSYAHAAIWNGAYEEALDPAISYLNSSSTLNANDPASKDLLLTIMRHVPKSKIYGVLPDLLQKQRANPAFYFALGDTLDRAGYNDLAIDLYSLGLRLEPRFARGLFRLGRDYEVVRKDYPAALFLYEQAYKLSPQDPEIQEYLVRLEDRVKNRDNDIAWQLKDFFRGGATKSALGNSNAK